jgi:hypothetical protein
MLQISEQIWQRRYTSGPALVVASAAVAVHRGHGVVLGRGMSAGAGDPLEACMVARGTTTRLYV